MSRATKLKRRFPKILADRLSLALHAVRDLGHEKMLELLAIHRRNRAKCIATWGVLNNGAPVEGLEPIPLEHIHYIARLDEVFQELHEYMNGGADDYVASDVEKAINSIRAQGPRNRINDYEQIGSWLCRKGYAASDNKKALVGEAKAKFGVADSTVRRALRACGLTGKKKTPVT